MSEPEVISNFPEPMLNSTLPVTPATSLWKIYLIPT